jgi:hypothetical protein
MTDFMNVNPALTLTGPVAPTTLSLQLNQDQLISPDSLMAYCESRLRGIDDQVKQAFAAQQKSNADQQALGDLNQWLHTYAYGGIKGSDSQRNDDACNAIQSTINRVGADTQAGRELQQLKDQIAGRKGGEDISADEIEKTFVQRIKDITGEVSGGAELNMINLQSLMSQRQMAVQLSTNLVQTLGDMTNKVVANIHG